MASVISAGLTSGTSLNLTGDTSGQLQFQTNGTTAAMTIDTSQNVGIGTASPTFAAGTGLQVKGSGFTSARISAGSYTGLDISQTNSTGDGYVYLRDNAPLIFGTNNTERMRLDSSGNLGLGVTPSAWYAAGSYGRAIQIGSTSSIYDYSASANNQTHLLSNAFLNASGSWVYLNSNYATNYKQATGQHQWFTAPSGTAGTGITFTQAMTLDASGNLGVGTSSPGGSNRIDARGAAGSGGGEVSISLTDTTSGNPVKLLRTGGTYGYAGIGASEAAIYTYGSNMTLCVDGAYAMKFAVNSSERMRIDSSGNVGIGTTGPTFKLQVLTSVGGNGLNVTDGTASDFQVQPGKSSGVVRVGPSTGAMAFYTADSERMRIDSSGRVMINDTTTPSGAGNTQFYVKNTTADYVMFASNSNASPAGNFIKYSAAAPNNTGNEFLTCADSSANRIIFRSNGGIANYSANNVNLSDAREKTNVELASSYLDKICAIPVKTFNYIDQNLEEDDGLTLGVIAQEVQAVAPELVMESNWGTKEEPKMRFGIYQTDLQYALMKCIQELKAELDTVKTELATLKGTA